MNEMIKNQHQQWAQDLDDQRQSRLTQHEWCWIHGISIRTFEYRCRIWVQLFVHTPSSQKANCRDEITLLAAMLAWLKYRKQRTRNSRKRFLVLFRFCL